MSGTRSFHRERGFGRLSFNRDRLVRQPQIKRYGLRSCGALPKSSRSQYDEAAEGKTKSHIKNNTHNCTDAGTPDFAAHMTGQVCSLREKGRRAGSRLDVVRRGC